MGHSSIRQYIRGLVFGGLSIALVFVATAFIPYLPVPFTEGYIHVGDSMIFVAAILFGWRYGAIAGGLGSAFADIILGYGHWALPTLIIKGIMGAIVGWIARDVRGENSKALTVGVTGGVITIWIALGLLARNALMGLPQSELAQMIINDFELGNMVGLNDLIHKVQLVLLIASIMIPLTVILIALFLRRIDKGLFSVGSLLGMTIAGVWMVIGYYFAGGILKGNMIVPIFSIPSNILQFLGGIVIGYMILIGLKKTRINFDDLLK